MRPPTCALGELTAKMPKAPVDKRGQGRRKNQVATPDLIAKKDTLASLGVTTEEGRLPGILMRATVARIETCDRIQARAIRRCGELLREIPKQLGGGDNRPTTRRDAPPSASPRQQAARSAGLSRDQAKQAIRVANIPAHDFEEAVEADEPATVTELADRGKRPAPRPLVDLKGRDPQELGHLAGPQRALPEGKEAT